MVGVPLVAELSEPAEVHAVARDDPIALRGGEQATELGLPPQPLLCARIAAVTPHEREA